MPFRKMMQFCEKKESRCTPLKKNVVLETEPFVDGRKGSPGLDSLEKVAKRMGMQVKDLLE
ncbi:MAG: hypothetical protein ACLUAR_20270 [Pilosibacter sp.]